MTKAVFFSTLLIYMCLIAGCSHDHHSAGKPLIGISCSHADNNSIVRRTYSEAVIRAGGIPVMIPVTAESCALADIIDLTDGLILTGGEDVHPSYYGETPIEQLGAVDSLRDIYDLTLIRLAGKRQMPILGICRGEQLINVAFGGTLYQDIPTQHPDSSVCHNQSEPSHIPTHTVYLQPRSIPAIAAGTCELLTNSHHHQAVKQVAPGFKVTARSADSIPEAIEHAGGLPIWGVQFHPETRTVAGDSVSLRFFRHFIGQAKKYQSGNQER